ncbi:polyphosphate kinase 2 [Psychromonas sp. 14N.309.X.WAT.B.A12]|uniref:polyphosphate kinase 2 n=1 Tax=Psychromonas sp. 14N.309.X.WAT.B.A12 TaxID=2998322 RepID=UPI0025B084B6|nr:polyphosphate kinase 2 [Psychromonas sp. 14N.309.X.WAT.B.A12]MDN2662502.1 polyphosphate kinase 2 [Psychromonas sp. 14N.309.X.WAT.B.A12]
MKQEQSSAKKITNVKQACTLYYQAIKAGKTTPLLSTKESLKLLHQEGTFTYSERLNKKEYETSLAKLQIELVKLQDYLLNSGKRLVVICEGRDAAGKGGAIKRFTEYLNPRHAKVIALDKPSDREQGQWYFQRYIDHFPSAGEIVFFDRSWYNRAGVERVMNFSSKDDLARFYQQAPLLESMLVESDIVLVKFWFTVEKLEQLRRFHERMSSPLKQWKLSPMDFEALEKWNEYATARDDMFKFTDKKSTPWITINSNDKRRARIHAIRHLLSQFDYPDKDNKLVNEIDNNIVLFKHN